MPVKVMFCTLEPPSEPRRSPLAPWARNLTAVPTGIGSETLPMEEFPTIAAAIAAPKRKSRRPPSPPPTLSSDPEPSVPEPDAPPPDPIPVPSPLETDDDDGNEGDVDVADRTPSPPDDDPVSAPVDSQSPYDPWRTPAAGLDQRKDSDVFWQ